jgi:tRNA threonylcarbamoyladenosine biosynthesis protein TsaB
MRLYLDTSDNLKTVVKLDAQEWVRTYDYPRDQDVMGAIQAALAEATITIHDITEIDVCEGPGSFTGLRVGISIANALALALAVPLNGNPVGIFLEPKYGKLPNISIPHRS